MECNEWTITQHHNYVALKGTSPILACLGVNIDDYERLFMLFYSLKHVESPLGISSTQTPITSYSMKLIEIRIYYTYNKFAGKALCWYKLVLLIASIFWERVWFTKPSRLDLCPGWTNRRKWTAPSHDARICLLIGIVYCTMFGHC